MTYQFTVAQRIEAPGTEWDGELYVIPGLVTPLIKADTPTEAIQSLAQWCKENRCTIYEVIR